MRNTILKLLIDWDERDPAHWDISEDWSDPVDGLKVRALKTDSGIPRIMESICAPGFVMEYHAHPNHNERLHVLDGVAKVQVVKANHYLEPGDVLYIPKGVLHRAVYPNGAHLIIVFSK